MGPREMQSDSENRQMLIVCHFVFISVYGCMVSLFCHSRFNLSVIVIGSLPVCGLGEGSCGTVSLLWLIRLDGARLSVWDGAGGVGQQLNEAVIYNNRADSTRLFQTLTCAALLCGASVSSSLYSQQTSDSRTKVWVQYITQLS